MFAAHEPAVWLSCSRPERWRLTQGCPWVEADPGVSLGRQDGCLRLALPGSQIVRGMSSPGPRFLRSPGCMASGQAWLYPAPPIPPGKTPRAGTPERLPCADLVWAAPEMLVRVWIEADWSGTQRRLLFSRSVLSDSLRPGGLQHARLPCPSPSPGAFSNSCPMSR